jgi:carbamoyl-phosphate synthase / aspartate carbamoyltransferase / dihydroorotase
VGDFFVQWIEPGRLYFFARREKMIKLPGLIDLHVHMREPGAVHKEDWESGTAAAVAGGITLVLAMPNTQPPITSKETLQLSLQAAQQKAFCDFAQYVGAGPDNTAEAASIASMAAGLKMYLDQTYGPLRLDDMTLWMEHFSAWPRTMPIAAHAESRTLAAVILMAALYDRPVHLCHVSLREEILLIKAAKERGIKVTCEVAPHHLFLTKEDIPSIGTGRGEVRPRLAGAADRDALWENLAVIDCFATDHAPHTIEEKDSENPPPGFPGLETVLPLLLTAVHEGRLTLDDILLRMVENPRRIFKLPEQPETYIEVDMESRWNIRTEEMKTRSRWTPFEDWPVRGKVRNVFLRGRQILKNGELTGERGYGKNIRNIEG